MEPISEQGNRIRTRGQHPTRLEAAPVGCGAGQAGHRGRAPAEAWLAHHQQATPSTPRRRSTKLNSDTRTKEQDSFEPHQGLRSEADKAADSGMQLSALLHTAQPGVHSKVLLCVGQEHTKKRSRGPWTPLGQEDGEGTWNMGHQPVPCS